MAYHSVLDISVQTGRPRGISLSHTFAQKFILQM